MHADGKRHDDEISERIIGCAFAVANTLGSGCLEKVYENALAHELRKADFMVNQRIAIGQKMAIGVEYDGVAVGSYIADLLVENVILAEIEAVKILDMMHDAQCLNYLKAIGLKVRPSLNVANSRLRFRRLVNDF